MWKSIVRWSLLVVFLLTNSDAFAQKRREEPTRYAPPDLGLFDLQFQWDDGLADLVAKCRKAAQPNTVLKLDSLDLRDVNSSEALYALINASITTRPREYNLLELPVYESLSRITMSPMSLRTLPGVEFEVTIGLGSSPGLVVRAMDKCRLVPDAEFLTAVYLRSVEIHIVDEKACAHAFGESWREFPKAVDAGLQGTGISTYYGASGESFQVRFDKKSYCLYARCDWELDSNGFPVVSDFKFQHRSPTTENELQNEYTAMIRKRLGR